MVKRLLRHTRWKDTGWLGLILHIKVIFLKGKPDLKKFFFYILWWLFLSLAIILVG